MISIPSTIFQQLLTPYTPNEGLSQQLWKDIQTHYNGKGRYYHTLRHLQNMYEQLLPIKEKIEDWDTLLFSLFYHDIVYSATAKDNEEQSAAIAEKHLLQIQYLTEKIALCKQQILATKSHSIAPDADTNYFTDADLSILGAGWPEYEAYTKAIRKEYCIYPDLLYKPGRRKVLQHFLSMEKIYKTVHFQNLYEAIAKENMEQELAILT